MRYVDAVIRWRDGQVTAIRRRWPGAVEVDVAVTGRMVDDPESVRALAYPPLVGEPEVGDRVLLNLGALRSRLAGVVTVGQAFGGDLEATNVHGGLLAARHVLGADVAVVAQGPGNLGTGTTWGFSGTAVGEAVNATVALGGRAVG